MGVKIWKQFIVFKTFENHGKIELQLRGQYSGRRLMGSRIMGSIGLWDQIYLICQIPNYHFLPNVCLVDLLIRINWLLESLSLCPKVIPLSGTHCTTNASTWDFWICFCSNGSETFLISNQECRKYKTKHL